MPSTFIADLTMSRRSALKSSLALGLAGLPLGMSAAASGAQTRGGLDYADPADNLYAFGKIWAGYDEPVIGGFHGLMYARFGDRRMVPVFGYTGTGVLLAKIDDDGNLWVKSRETGFFTDLETGDILETWYNPFTEKTVEVYHFYNDILVGKIGKQIPKFFFGAEGDSPTLMNEGTVFPDANGDYPFVLPFQSYGDDMMLSWDYTHEYTNPVTLEGWPRSSTGSRISPSEHFTFNFSRRELEDRDIPTSRLTAGFSRISQFWPFMEMGGTPYANGSLFGRMFSHKGLSGYDDVPPKVLAYLEKHAPDFLTLPDHWNINTRRVETWKAYAYDVPPENPDYEWQPDDFNVPTGKGSKKKT
ncbi:MAG: DUF1838 family protein [Gammaproteobacteria bacterium]|jgi:hypothetical protein|nr:hypothetical protein [Chromatiales bacterium]MDP6674268.1 DUF1838 family protein [Gammaproteobacteria bacterium]